MPGWVLLIMLYVLADFCDAGLPGAFNFSAEDSVEVVRGEKLKTPANPLRTASPEPRIEHVRRDDTRRPNAHLAAITITAQSPTILLRPRIRDLVPEDGPAASPAV
jgi:hypothetical protein